MTRWRVNPATLFVLGCMAFLMLLIVVLPDVDLPETAFHDGIAPIAIHAKATAPPVATAIACTFQTPKEEKESRIAESRVLAGDGDRNFRSIMLRSLRC